MNITATDSAVETVCQALLAYSSQFAGGDPPVTPFAGLRVPLSSMLGVELPELLVHGFDVAHAAGLAWPVEPAVAATALAGKIITWGRKPWLLLRLQSVLNSV